MERYTKHSNTYSTIENRTKEYSIQQLASLAGISTRTLRHYDAIGLLKPAWTTEAGYRYYSSTEVDLLQLIRFYKALDMKLEEIMALVSTPGFDRISALREHKRRLIDQRARIDCMIDTLDQTLSHHERSIPMNDHEKFKGFIAKVVEENETKYGQELRMKFGDETMDDFNARMKDMSKQDYDDQKALEESANRLFITAFATGDYTGPLAMEAASKHAEWIRSHWGHYAPDAHAGLAEMYVADERFEAYYEALKPGMTKFVHDSILSYVAQLDQTSI